MFREVGALLLDHLSLATWTGGEVVEVVVVVVVVVVVGLVSLTGLAVLLLESPLVHHGEELVIVALIRPTLAAQGRCNKYLQQNV